MIKIDPTRIPEEHNYLLGKALVELLERVKADPVLSQIHAEHKARILEKENRQTGATV